MARWVFVQPWIRSVLPLLLLCACLGLTPAPAAAAAPLPCADSLLASVEEMLSSLQTLGLPGPIANILEAMARAAIGAADLGDVQAALRVLGFLESRIEALVRSGRLDPVTGESLIGLVEQARSVLSSCTATPPLLTFNSRSGDGEIELLWLSPTSGYAATTILYRTDRFPQGPTDPAALQLGTFPGSPGTVGRATHIGLANDTRYYYAAYADDGSGALSPGRLTFGRPQSRTGSFRWAYTAGGAGRPSVGGLTNALVTASSAGFVFGLAVGPDGGAWAADWIPARVPAPGPERVIALPSSVSPQGVPLAIATSLEGRIVALNALSGETLWTSPRLGGEVRASVCGMFRAFGGVDDVLMIGTANPGGGNRFYALKPADGTVAWVFDNGGGPNGIGPISRGCAVDYERRQVYFTSSAVPGRSQDTVWALLLTPGSVAKSWSARVAGANTGATLRDRVLYLGTASGEVHALGADDGQARWAEPWTSGDGPVKAFVFPQRGSTKLSFSTSHGVHLIQDDGAAASAVWAAPVVLTDPNVPILVTETVFVADAGGAVYALDATSSLPAAVPFAQAGDPARLTRPGLPYLDTRGSGWLYVFGTNEGVLYAVETP